MLGVMLWRSLLEEEETELTEKCRQLTFHVVKFFGPTPFHFYDSPCCDCRSSETKLFLKISAVFTFLSAFIQNQTRTTLEVPRPESRIWLGVYSAHTFRLDQLTGCNIKPLVTVVASSELVNWHPGTEALEDLIESGPVRRVFLVTSCIATRHLHFESQAVATP